MIFKYLPRVMRKAKHRRKLYSLLRSFNNTIYFSRVIEILDNTEKNQRTFPSFPSVSFEHEFIIQIIQYRQQIAEFYAF